MSNHYDVIVIGAGVVGPAIATSLARQGRKVLIIERDWKEPDRIVGELLQPGGIKALKQLGMIAAINDIDAIPVKGYYIDFGEHKVVIPYPYKNQVDYNYKPVSNCVYDGNDKLNDDNNLIAKEFEEDENVRGVAFHHGSFIQKLRSIVKNERNVQWIEGTAIHLIEEEKQVKGVEVRLNDKTIEKFTASITISCDGIYSKFRKHLSATSPTIESHFIGLTLKDAKFPVPNHGNVIMGDHAPVLVYQISSHDTRVLCAYNSSKPPSNKNNILKTYLADQVYPNFPAELKPSFKAAIEKENWKIMPNQYLTAKKNIIPGLLVLGDSLNMRHPLTGGGMTVGLNDAVLIAELLSPEQVLDLSETGKVLAQLNEFHLERKKLDSVINTLSIALYSLFAADNRYLKILQNGCFSYFQIGGDCISKPAGLLSGLLPQPSVLFVQFFNVAFYGIYINFVDRGLIGFPIALYEAFATLMCAIYVFTPYLWTELIC